MYIKYLPILIAITITGCTSVQVRQVDTKLHTIDHICIENNPKVQVDDFITVMENRFIDHGISSEVFEGAVPSHCKYIATYTARRSWDFVTYLTYAEIKIRKDNKIIGSATYRHSGGSMSLSPFKWAGTDSKMTPVIEELLNE